MPQADTVKFPKRLPLVLDPQNRNDSTRYDAKLVNAYLEFKQTPEGMDSWIYQRPGLLELSQPPTMAAVGRGCFNWQGDVYAVFAGTLYKNGVAIMGSVEDAGQYRFNSTLGGTPKLVLGNGANAYTYNTSSGLTHITAGGPGNFPATFVRGWAYLDGTLYVMVAAQAEIDGSNINAPDTWTNGNEIFAQIEPDNGVALAKQLVYVVAMKQWTTEFFFNAQNDFPASPLGPAQNMKLNQGCASADSVQDVEGSLMWLTASRAAGKQVAALTDGRLQVVSTRPVDRLLQDLSLSTIYSWYMVEAGHKFYGFTSTSSNLTLVYDLTENAWAQWTDKSGNYFPICSSTFDATGTILQHASNGKLYRCANLYESDAGDNITVDMYTPNFDGGTKRRKLMNMLQPVCDQKEGSILQVRVNDHDYNPTKWSNFRNIDLSVQNPFITGMGTFIRRAHHFRHNRPTRMPRIQAMDMQIDLGIL